MEISKMILQKEHEKFADSTLFEGMTSISAVINSGKENNRKIERVLIDTAKRKSKHAEIGFLTAKSHQLGFSVEFVSAEEINAITKAADVQIKAVFDSFK